MRLTRRTTYYTPHIEGENNGFCPRTNIWVVCLSWCVHMRSSWLCFASRRRRRRRKKTWPLSKHCQETCVARYGVAWTKRGGGEGETLTIGKVSRASGGEKNDPRRSRFLSKVTTKILCLKEEGRAVRGRGALRRRRMGRKCVTRSEKRSGMRGKKCLLGLKWGEEEKEDRGEKNKWNGGKGVVYVEQNELRTSLCFSGNWKTQKRLKSIYMKKKNCSPILTLRLPSLVIIHLSLLSSLP